MAEHYLNSVRIQKALCTGCLQCVKKCLPEAIRVRDGKALILSDKCIDCGECIRCCPTRAVEGWADDLDELKKYKVNIALATPSLYAQFDGHISASVIWQALREIGFSDVFDVALAGDYVSREMETYIREYTGPFPLVSSACPAVLRLIQTHYPELVKQVIPILAPAEAAAIYTRRETILRLGIPPEEVGIWFLSPCPAKGTNIHQSVDVAHTAVTGSFTINSLYGPLTKAIKKVQENCNELPAATLGSSYSLAWGSWQGELESTGTINAVVAQGPAEVNELLEQISMAKLTDVRYAVCYSCSGGCLGGPNVAVNKFIAAKNLHQRVQQRRDRESGSRELVMQRARILEHFPVSAEYVKALEPKPHPPLSENFGEALEKMQQLKALEESLPHLDCGGCGSPTCRAFAEDVVRGYVKEENCIFLKRVKNPCKL